MRREGENLKLYEAGWFEGESDARGKCDTCRKTVSGHRAWFGRSDGVFVMRVSCRPCLMMAVFGKATTYGDLDQAAVRISRGPK